MRTRYLGEAVRQRREALGVPQEMVCEGLCTAMTLSRFESGRQTPSWDCVTAILQRLGLPDDRFFAQLTRTETRMVLLRKEAVAYCSQFEHATGEKKQQAHVNAMEKLQELERCVKADDRINQQFILRMKSSLEPHSPQTQLEMLMKAIRLTSPRFHPDKIGNCLYSTDEVALINKIAIRYARCGQPQKAIEIYRQLLPLIQGRVPSRAHLPLITYNYARYLTLENQLDEALKIIELGRQGCVEQGYYHMLPSFLHTKAECHYLMGERDISLELYRAAYHIYGAIMDTKNQEILKADLKERLHLPL